MVCEASLEFIKQIRVIDGKPGSFVGDRVQDSIGEFKPVAVAQLQRGMENRFWIYRHLVTRIEMSLNFRPSPYYCFSARKCLIPWPVFGINGLPAS